MKLIRFGNNGNEKPGIELPGGKRIDVSAFGEDYSEDFFSKNGIDRLRKWLEKNTSDCPVINMDTRLGSPVHRPSKIVCIGLNYSDHATESKMQIPPENRHDPFTLKSAH